jgi:hypothetical protein
MKITVNAIEKWEMDIERDEADPAWPDIRFPFVHGDVRVDRIRVILESGRPVPSSVDLSGYAVLKSGELGKVRKHETFFPHDDGKGQPPEWVQEAVEHARRVKHLGEGRMMRGA